jgi:hypothetical protein
METVLGVDQLRGDAYAIVAAPHRSLEQVGDPERRTDLTQVLIAILVTKARRASGDLQLRDIGERVADLLGQPVGENLDVVVLRLPDFRVIPTPAAAKTTTATAAMTHRRSGAGAGEAAPPSTTRR